MNKKKFYVIGNKASKSLSPLIFNYWFEKNNIKAEYIFKEIEPKSFDQEINLILKEKNVCGFNVTIPYKELIIKKLDSTDEHSKKIGAVNYVIKKNNLWFGKNTDWVGFTRSLPKVKRTKVVESYIIQKPIVIGYGGAAKAVIYALQNQNAPEIKVFNRTYERVKNLNGVSQIKSFRLSEIKDHLKNCTLVINSTPINVFDNLGDFYKNHLVFGEEVMGCDIVYKPKESKFLSYFKENKRMYGINMLSYQAAPCFEGWFGEKPVIDAGLDYLLEKEISE